jgi:hypothetical protein
VRVVGLSEVWFVVARTGAEAPFVWLRDSQGWRCGEILQTHVSEARRGAPDLALPSCLCEEHKAGPSTSLRFARDESYIINNCKYG